MEDSKDEVIDLPHVQPFDFDYGASQKNRISTVVNDAAPNLSAVSNFGLYAGSPNSSPSHNDINPTTDFHKVNILRTV